MTAAGFQQALDAIANVIGPMKGSISAIGGFVIAVMSVGLGIRKKRRELAAAMEQLGRSDRDRAPAIRFEEADRNLLARVEDRLCDLTRELRDHASVLETHGRVVQQSTDELARAATLTRRNGGKRQ